MEGNVVKKNPAKQEVYRNTGEIKNEGLEDVLAGCMRKDAVSQEILYKKMYGYALSIAMKYCYRREEAMETVNDSFVKVFNKLDRFDLSSPFRPWFRRIVVNSAIDSLRANKKHAYHIDIEEAIPIEYPVNVISELNAEQVMALLDHLPPLHRYVFNLYEVDGYSHQEIAGLMGIPESSSRTYLARAKARLRLLYNKLYGE